MFNSLVVPVYKTIINRRDTVIFLAFSMIPLLIPFLAGNMDGLDIDYTKSFLNFLEMTLLTQYQLVLPTLIFSLLISSVFREEIDSKVLFLYKDLSRSSIFKAKITGLTLVYLLFVVATCVAAFLTYYLIMVPNFSLNSSLFPTTSQAIMKSLLMILSLLLLNAVTVVVVSAISIKSKTIVAAIVGVFQCLFFVVAPLLVGMKYLTPITYANEFEKTHLLSAILMIIGLSVLYYLVGYWNAHRLFKKVEF